MRGEQGIVVGANVGTCSGATSDMQADERNGTGRYMGCGQAESMDCAVRGAGRDVVR